MRISLLNKRWLLKFLPLGRLRVNNERIAGLCDAPTSPSKEILIDSRLEGRELLEVLIHEMTHATDWQKSEEFIARQARDVSIVLWKLGYRRIEDGKS